MTIPVFVCCNTDCHGVLHQSLGATHIAQDVLFCLCLFVATLIVMVYCTSPLVQHISPKLYCSYCSCLCLLQHWLPWCTAPVPWCNTYRPGCTVPVFVCCNTDCHGVLHLSLGATHIAQDVLYQSLFVATQIAHDVLHLSLGATHIAQDVLFLSLFVATLIVMVYCTCPLVQHISPRMYCTSLCLLQH